MKKILLLTLLLASYTSCAMANDTIRYRLKWLYNSSVAGDIYAQNFFKQAGLRVKIKEGSPEKNAIKELELRQAEFGVASADQVFRAQEKGAKVVVLAQIFQINPMQWIYRTPQTTINKLSELKGKKIAYTYGGNDETIMKALLTKAKIKENELSISGARFDFTPFLTNKVDIWPVYRNSQGVILQRKLALEGEKVGYLNPSSYGINFVANSVITSQRLMNEQPELVASFQAALLKGWREAMKPENEAQVLLAIAKLDRGNNDDVRREQLRATRQLVAPDGEESVGKINRKAWQQTQEMMLATGQLRSKLPLNQILPTSAHE